MKASPHYGAPLGGPHRGRGVAVGYWGNAGMPSSCSISVIADGTVSLVEGSSDLAGSRTALAMQAAEVLGIRAEDVHPAVGDTDSVGYTSMSGGSRTTFATGWAVYKAAQDIVHQMRGRAAILWGKTAAAVTFENGLFRAGRKSLTFKEVAARLEETGGPVVGRGAVNPSGVGGSFSGCIVDVEVDPETGKVSILRFTSVQDAGKAIHPSYVEGQMQGGSAQGIGWALNEEYFMSSSGVMLNSTLLDYRMPTCLDLPSIETIIVEVPNPGHPFGVRGVGEANIIPPPGAIANAIYRAAGVRLDRLPMNPCAVMEAIWKQGG
jgi:CO/xanthine dehydrogenase Mo-binding subunit